MSVSLNHGIRMPYGAFPLLRDLVHEHTGLNFDDAKKDMFLDKLSPLVAEQRLNSLLDYYYLLKDQPDKAAEWLNVFDALTVQESYFWREMDHVRALAEEIVPRYLKAHPHQPLNIWSAACAAGEEPLTIAMALDEEGWFERTAINIYASDASPRAIQRAKNGVYRERSFRSLPLDLREKYFVGANGENSNQLRASGVLHSRVRWAVANLMSEADLELAPLTSPIVFCRNVFIYFSQNAVRRTVQRFAERMPSQAYLFVGAAESLLKVTSHFELREIGEAFVYVRN